MKQKKCLCCEENKDLKRKVRNYQRAMWIIVLAVIGISLMLPYFFNNVDEDKFCENKLYTYFPEYEWNTIRYFSLFSGNGICKGWYTPQSAVKRDGLAERTEEKAKEFMIISYSDLMYVKLDDGYAKLSILGITIWVVIGGLLYSWSWKR